MDHFAFFPVEMAHIKSGKKRSGKTRLKCEFYALTAKIKMYENGKTRLKCEFYTLTAKIKIYKNGRGMHFLPQRYH